MTSEPRAATGREKREYATLLRLQRRLLAHLERLRDELAAPSTSALVRQLHQGAGSRVAAHAPTIKATIEEAIRALKVWGSEIEDEMASPADDSLASTLVEELPAPLARFLAERRQNGECRVHVVHDLERGRVIHWKEYTHDGKLRGGGQFAERPYAWLDD